MGVWGGRGCRAGSGGWVGRGCRVGSGGWGGKGWMGGRKEGREMGPPSSPLFNDSKTSQAGQKLVFQTHLHALHKFSENVMKLKHEKTIYRSTFLKKGIISMVVHILMSSKIVFK